MSEGEVMHRPGSAEEWVAYLLRDRVEREDLQALEEWCSQKPENRAEFQMLGRAWQLSHKLKDDPAVQGFLSSPPVPAPPGPRPRRRWLAAAAMISLALGAAFLVYRPDPGTEHSTGKGEQRTVVLGDGTQIDLNTSSSLRLAGGEKQVQLLEGEAFFDVRPQGKQPLSVTAGDRTIRVLGTSFNVLFQGEELVVSVLEGRVAVGAETGDGEAGAVRTVGAGETLKFEGEGPPHLSSGGPELDRVRAWRAGKVEFERTTLLDAVAELNRYTPRPLRLSEASLEGLLVSGVFRIERLADLESLRFALENSLPVEVRPRLDTLELTPSGMR